MQCIFLGKFVCSLIGGRGQTSLSYLPYFQSDYCNILY